MKIACLGWGSLIWRPDGLKIQNKWFEDGPILPIEFTRQSDDGRITLIVDSAKETKPVRTLWTIMTAESLEEAMLSLQNRESTLAENIYHVREDENTEDQIKIVVRNWLNVKYMDVAIWTGLSYSKHTDRKRPSIDYVIKHLDELPYEKRKVAEEYVRKAPKQIDTEYRREIEIKLGWSRLE